MKQPIRFFSIGLFTASIILLITYFYDDTSSELSDFTKDEIVEYLEEDDLRVISEEDYITFTVYKEMLDEEEIEGNENKEENKDDHNKQATEEKEEDNDEKEEEKTYTLKVTKGMVPEEIAELLEENNIIDDAYSFASYLEDNGYSPYVQIDSYKLSSEMSRKEIAEKITKNRRP